MAQDVVTVMWYVACCGFGLVALRSSCPWLVLLLHVVLVASPGADHLLPGASSRCTFLQVLLPCVLETVPTGPKARDNRTAPFGVRGRVWLPLH